MAAMSEEIYRPDQKHSRLYRVDPGDTAGKIARLHGVSLEDLIAFNNLDNRATIYVDQNLRIPLPEGRAPMIASLDSPRLTKKERRVSAGSVLADKPQIKNDTSPKIVSQTTPEKMPIRRTPSIDTAPPEPAKPVTAPNVDAESENILDDWGDDIAHLHRASLISGISRTSSSDSESDDRNNSIIDRQPLPEAVAAAEQAQTPVAGHEPDPDLVTGRFSVEQVIQYRKQPVGIIQVEIEETLGHYAEWADVRASDIRRLNGIRYGVPIHLGQKLKIPLHRATKEAFEETRFEYHKELVEDFFAAYRVETVQYYSIKKGDNIWTLSREEFELPLWLIRRYNGNVDLGALVPSQNLRIPVVEKTI
jgi:membrane-bound lytic murein transglycosylase D